MYDKILTEKVLNCYTIRFELVPNLINVSSKDSDDAYINTKRQALNGPFWTIDRSVSLSDMVCFCLQQFYKTRSEILISSVSSVTKYWNLTNKDGKRRKIKRNRFSFKICFLLFTLKRLLFESSLLFP